MSCQIWQDGYLCRFKKRALQTLNEEIANLYGGAVRVRVCGICMQENRILLVNHGMYGKEGYFWSPPGGGIAFGEPAHEALVREFREETGLFVKPGRLLFVNEHIQSPLHAIELFFEIEFFDGTLLAGTDPELTTDGQIIRGVRFMTWEELTAFSAQQRHRIFSQVTSLAGILELNKYIAGENGRSND